MFAEFLEYFGEAPVLEDGAADPYDAFIDGLGGRSFGDGVFRVFERSDLERWHRVVSGCFTKLRGEFNLIGYDLRLINGTAMGRSSWFSWKSQLSICTISGKTWQSS